MKYLLILVLLAGCGTVKQRVIDLAGAQCGTAPSTYQEYDVKCKKETCVYTIACKRVK